MTEIVRKRNEEKRIKKKDATVHKTCFAIMYFHLVGDSSGDEDDNSCDKHKNQHQGWQLTRLLLLQP